jgi:hypothetical protein
VILSPDSFCAWALPRPNVSPHTASAAHSFVSFTVSPLRGRTPKGWVLNTFLFDDDIKSIF